MNPVRRILAATVLAGALLFAGHDSSQAQVVPEPAMLTARVPITETFQAYVAFPDNSFVMGGMIRFPITRDADLGGRAGLWIIDDASDTPFAGADLPATHAHAEDGENPSGSDAALLLDVGALFPIAQSLGANVSIRFGDGLFDEGDQIVVGLGATWQL